MQIAVSIDAGDESVQFEFREGDALASGDPTALVGKAIERLQALYPQGSGSYLKLETPDEAMKRVYHGKGRAIGDTLERWEEAQQAAEVALNRPEADTETGAPLTAQENAGPAPWEQQEAEAKAEQPAKPKRRSNEQLAADAGVDLDDVKEWKGGGRITKADIEEFAKFHASAVNNQTLDEAAQEEQDGQDGVPFAAPATDAPAAPAVSQAAPVTSTGTPSPSSATASEPEETPEAEFANADDEAEEVDDGWKPPF